MEVVQEGGESYPSSQVFCAFWLFNQYHLSLRLIKLGTWGHMFIVLAWTSMTEIR